MPQSSTLVSGKIGSENWLVIINGEGETIVITPEFEIVLGNAIGAKGK